MALGSGVVVPELVGAGNVVEVKEAPSSKMSGVRAPQAAAATAPQTTIHALHVEARRLMPPPSAP
jgi:hypothetical protein